MRISRRTRYLALGAGLFVAGSVVFNIGLPERRTDRAADLRALASQLAGDMRSCNSSARDSFVAYTDVVQGHPAERAAAEKLISDDEQYCTPVGNTDLYDLSTLEVPGTLRAYDLQPAVQDLGSWAFPNAAAAITDVASLLSHPGDPAVRADLGRRLAQMAQLSASAGDSFDRAAAALGTRVEPFDLGAPDRLGPRSF